MSGDRHLVELMERFPEPVFSKDELVFSPEEKQRIKEYVAMYPKAQGAIMRTLWVAQEKFGFLPPEVIQLCADEIEIPYSIAYGVATFYTQYYKEKQGKFVIDVCTCFSCGLCGGFDMLHYLESKLGITNGETTADGMFTVKGVECLGSCGSAPMAQIANGPYVHHLTKAKVDQLLDDLRSDKLPGFTSITLPQDEDEMGGNRRTDVAQTEAYQEPYPAEDFD